MSQQTLQSFFKREPKRARDDELATSSPASSFAAPPPPPAAAASSSSAPLAAVKQRVVSTFRAERAHKAAKSERAPGESLGLKFDFAEPENLRDAQGRRPSDPDYDSRCKENNSRVFALLIFFFSFCFKNGVCSSRTVLANDSV